MAVGSHSLPLAAGARVAPRPPRPAPRWAAPDPAALVLDPWSPPVEVAIAADGVASWPRPVALARVQWMAAPAALLPPPAGLPGGALAAPASDATERALAVLRAISESAPAAAPARPLPPPLLGARPILPSAPAFPPPDRAARVVDADEFEAGVRWRLMALATAAAASLAAAATAASFWF